MNGSNGKDIEHEPTIKIEINGKKIPITIEHDPKLHKNANTIKNRKLLMDHMPSIKQFIFNDRKNLIKYWYINPNDKGNIEKLNPFKEKLPINIIRRNKMEKYNKIYWKTW